MSAYYHALLLIIFSNLLACQSTSTLNTSTDLDSITPSTAHFDSSSLGTLQAQLKLPQNEDCFLFIAESLDVRDHIFEIDVSLSRTRNNQFTFLHYLPEGEYALRGKLVCETQEYYSLPARFEIQAEHASDIDFRFFFDVEEELGNIDLKFCAEVALEQLNPYPTVCTQELIHTQYSLQ